MIQFGSIISITKKYRIQNDFNGAHMRWKCPVHDVEWNTAPDDEEAPKCWIVDADGNECTEKPVIAFEIKNRIWL